MLPSPMRALGRRSSKENSPDELHLAVLTGRTKRIKHLVKKGVHIESVNTLGQTPLFCAAYGGDYEIVKVLLRLGANPNRRCGSGGAAPIHAAAFRGSRRVLRLLVEAGGDLSLRDAELLTPRDYAGKQPAPLRRQKILDFLDLLFAMTLHRMTSSGIPSTLPSSSSSSSACGGALSSDGGSNHGTLRNTKLKKGIFGGSQLSLSRKASHQSTASIWSSCVSEVSSVGPATHNGEEVPSKSKEIVLTPNLHKSVSCHLLDQLCVTTSLPLLSPAQLHRPPTPSPAYTCGGPTVYSSFSWLGTPVTVRRPTPALSLSRQGRIINDGGDDDSPDQEAVKSLLQELAFLRRLRHPGFLEVMAACHVTHPSPDHVTLVYQHVPHGSLYHHLHVQHHDLSVGGAVDILIGLVEALLFMHAHGWLHCGLSSHAVHLVSLSSAKLGGFEYAFESQIKGVGMRGEHLSKAGWLRPWQAPETVLERMVSVRSEVYSLAAIIWELWSGMPPWSGIEEDEISKRVEKLEILPPLKGVSLSLVSYLTEYGLKWNAHERELDLQEAHTMLRSLRIQCQEEDRVPVVTSWGPPSIPNTPVVGRHRDVDSSQMTTTTSSSSSSEDKREYRYNEIMGIKPASHQLTRHSSSCSLASGPSSPSHKVPVSAPLLSASRSERVSSSQDCLNTTPKNTPSKFNTLPLPPRSLSVFADKGALLSEATAPPKSHPRRLHDSHKRNRRIRRKHEMEFEEEFIDDEFDANLYDQPHMQLSVGSSENLLDHRLSYTLVDDSASSSSLSQSHPSRTVTSSEDEEDFAAKGKGSLTTRPPMKALEETGDSDNADEAKNETKGASNESGALEKKKSWLQDYYERKNAKNENSPAESKSKDKESKSSPSTSESESESGWKGCQKGTEESFKDFEPLKSSKATRTLEKNFSNYLPTYSLGSDTEDSGDA